MKNYYTPKFKKISEKELRELREEKLYSWFDKNEKYLSLEELKEVIENEIDPILAKQYQSESLGNLSNSQRDNIHKKLFSREEKKQKVLTLLKKVSLENNCDYEYLSQSQVLINKIRMVLDSQNLGVSEKTLRYYLSDLVKEEKLFRHRLQGQFHFRDFLKERLLASWQAGNLEEEKAVSLLLKNEEGREKLGIQNFANLQAEKEFLGESRSTSLLENFNLEFLEEKGLIEWTQKQHEAIDLFHSESIKTLVLFGGGRSGKTTVAVGLVFERALENKNHQSIIVRQNFNALKRSIVDQTINGFYKRTFNLDYRQNLSSPAKIMFDNGSTINLAGIEGSNKTSGLDAHLGNEYGTIYLNETSQISFESFKLLMTRANDPNSSLKIIIDLNPTSMNHWVYKYFVEGVDPETDEPLSEEILSSFGVLQMNPADNLKNLNEEYLNMIRSLGTAHRRRFEMGEFSNFNENSIFPIDWMQWENIPDVEKFDYIAIAVDPAVSSKKTSDETGIVVCAFTKKGSEHRYYVLDDLSGRYTPETWAKIAVETYHKYKNKKAVKDTLLILEKNQGGDTLNSILRGANGGISIPIKDVFTQKDKISRAMYISSLYEKRQVIHTQKFKKLESQLSAMGMDEYLDHDDRADALIHSLTYLFNLNNKGVRTLDLY